MQKSIDFDAYTFYILYYHKLFTTPNTKNKKIHFYPMPGGGTVPTVQSKG